MNPKSEPNRKAAGHPPAETGTDIAPEHSVTDMDPQPQSDKGADSFPIVGIGASAGGLEAIEEFFEAMPVNSGIAFIVVQHLSPDYKSLMVELLSRKTDIPVQRAEEGMQVEADNIYLIPPRKTLTIFHQRLLLEDKKPRESNSLPVDIFLRSLADDHGEHAVAVILSGTGSDGTRGVRAVKESGGLIMVQDEESAKFDGMPRAAAMTGLADFILTPKEMPSQLLACLRHPYTGRQERQREALGEETGMTRLFSLLRSKTKVDFTYYKPSTITRRVERRIAVTQSDDLDDYVRYAGQTPAEISALYRELLIGVTNFFRDPEVWNILREQVLPRLFTESSKTEMRFWVAGCSTGEEAYTLAIICREVLEATGLARDIKIFATDVDREALNRAGIGLYPESITADLTPTLLTKYFHRRGDHYQVTRSLREMVVFAQHNLVKDPPFPRIDLVSCRNLLIYLQSNLQRRALEMFAFSLRSGGILLQGSSETVGDMDAYFEAIDRRLCIFKSLGKAQVRSAPDDLLMQPRERTPQPATASFGGERRSPSRAHDRMLERLLHSLSESYVPLAVIVDENLEMLHMLGDPDGVFRVPAGRVVYDISKMVDRELSIPLASGIQKVLNSGEELIYSNVRLTEGETTRKMRLRMRPLPGRKNDETMVVVFFEDVEEKHIDNAETSEEYDLDAETAQRLQDLEQDLQFTRENLQATIEELETSNEELQATNEELLSSNEELQSTNEELQSTNEELYTVNAEHQSKIIELTEARNDVENLLSSSRIGTLILDEDMQIRHYSPQTAEVFNLVESDVGRPLQHLSHCLKDFDALAMARESQLQDQTLEHEAQDEEGHWYLVRVMPYRVGNKMITGVVITLIEITRQKHALEALQRKEHDLRESQRIAHVGSWRMDVATNEVVWTEELYNMFGFDPSLPVPPYTEHMKLFTPESWERLSTALAHTRESGDPYTLELETIRTDGTNGWMWVQGEAEVDAAGNTLELWGAAQDITERKRTEERLLKLKSAVEQSVSTIVITDVEGNIEYANPQFEITTGYTVEEALGQNPRILKSDNIKPEEYKELWDTILAGKEWRGEFHNKRKDGSTYWEYATISPIRDSRGKLTHFLAVKEDITELLASRTELKRIKAQHHRQRELLDAAEQIAHTGSWSWNPDTDSMSWSINLYQLLQRDPERGTPDFSEFIACFAPESMEQLQQAVQDATVNGKSHELRLSAMRSDGTTFACVASVKTDADESGKITQLYGSLQEIQL
ncbi:MAG: chemotaxis protein CheB [Thermodesulfobacteriota bacterium]